MKRLAFVGILPVAALILAAFLPLFNAEACTRMFWNTNGQAMLVGRNMDFHLDDQPIFYVFPQGISKNGGIDVNPATWTSQYGSLVVTALGTSNFSAEGVNTAGLAFHFLWLTSTQYENRDGRPGVLNVSYGEYLLDNAATVGDALLLMYPNPGGAARDQRQSLYLSPGTRGCLGRRGDHRVCRGPDERLSWSGIYHPHQRSSLRRRCQTCGTTSILAGVCRCLAITMHRAALSGRQPSCRRWMLPSAIQRP